MALCEQCVIELEHGVVLPIAMRGPIWEIDGERRHAPPILRRMFKLLWSRRGDVVARESMMQVLYSLRNDPPDAKGLDVNIWRLRRLLRGSGLRILTAWGQGWQLEASADDERHVLPEYQMRRL